MPHAITDDDVHYAQGIAHNHAHWRGLEAWSAEDLKQEAVIGCLDAATRWNAESGVKFTTFAYKRILGAIEDHARRAGTVRKPRSVAVAPQIDSLNVVIGEDGEQWIEFISDPFDVDAFFEAFALREMVERLPQNEGSCITLYFWHGYELKEIAKELGITESRVSQIMSRAVQRLRRWFGCAQDGHYRLRLSPKT